MLKLRDYQIQAVERFKYLPAFALYFGTGTGKTITSLELVKYFPVDNLLVIAPHNALGQWKKTVRDYYPHYDIIELRKSWTSKQINNYLKERKYGKRTMLVLNYEKVDLIPYLNHLIDSNWCIIADEIHRIKNYGTPKNPVKTTHAMLNLANKVIYKIGLTATPTQGNYGGYIEYFPQLKFLGYTDLTYKEFYDRYTVTRDMPIAGLPFPIKTIIGYKRINEIEEVLQNIAASYQPSYNELEPQHITVELDKPRSYNKTIREKSYKDIALNNQARVRIAKKTLTTGRIAGKNMFYKDIEYVDNTIKIDWIKDFMQDADGPVVVMYQYNVELKSLVEMAKSMGLKYRVVNGSTRDKFEEIQGEWDILFGQFQAMSEALDGLQYISNIMIYFSMPESSIHYRQSLGRIDRIGQEKTPIYYFLIMEKTIDVQIMNMINEKLEFSEETLNTLEMTT